jgi:hypothetical protein
LIIIKTAIFGNVTVALVREEHLGCQKLPSVEQTWGSRKPNNIRTLSDISQGVACNEFIKLVF